MSEPTTTAEAVTDYREGAPAPSRTMELLVAAVAVVLMVVVLVLAHQVELRREAGPGQIDARFWPTVLGWAGLAVSVWRLGVAWLREPDEREDLERLQPGGIPRLLATLAIGVAFVLVWGLREVVALGYELQVFPYACLAMLVALVWLYGGRGWKALVLFPVVTTALIYVLFGTLLGIPL